MNGWSSPSSGMWSTNKLLYNKPSYIVKNKQIDNDGSVPSSAGDMIGMLHHPFRYARPPSFMKESPYRSKEDNIIQ